MDDSTEFFVEASRLQRELTVILVDVEHPALRARRRRRIGFVDGGLDAVNAENASESEAAEAGADDGDGVHVLLCSWNVVPIPTWNAVPDLSRWGYGKNEARVRATRG